MSNSFTVTTHTSWFTRIKNSVLGVLFGLILVVATVIGLFWNEGRAVQTARSLTEGAGVVVSVKADGVDPANDGKLIHVTGDTTTTSTPSDTMFGISTPGIRLVRNVEMYQWKETSKSETQDKVGGGQETVTTYTYSKEWSDDPQDSSDFKQPAGHENPPMEIRTQRFQVEDAKLGAFTLSENVISMIGGEKQLTVSPSQTEAIDAAYQGNKRVTVAENRIYLGFNSTSPAVGDYRISYEVAPTGATSIIGKQANGGFEHYQTKAGDALLMVDAGTVSAEQMFADAQSANVVITWILRAVGLIVAIIGFSLIMAPLSVLAAVIPPLGRLVGFGTGIVAFVLGIVLTSVTIAVAWFWYRPIVSLIVIVVGFAIAYGIIWLGRSRQKAAGAVPTAAAAPAA
ncbi:MAG TPA: TMEM43 family protein [Rhizobiaceae bacterium]|nr:TMEM43 family protein [Rhizobiaceae bacterium]